MKTETPKTEYRVTSGEKSTRTEGTLRAFYAYAERIINQLSKKQNINNPKPE